MSKVLPQRAPSTPKTSCFGVFSEMARLVVYNRPFSPKSITYPTGISTFLRSEIEFKEKLNFSAVSNFPPLGADRK
jgi:hypothetical protein